MKCQDCQENAQQPTNGKTYKLCRSCWVRDNKEFWSKKSNMQCASCKQWSPIEQWKRDKDGLPFRWCLNCAADYAKKKAPTTLLLLTHVVIAMQILVKTQRNIRNAAYATLKLALS